MTGREVLKEVAGEEATEELYARGFVCVPKVPTKQMVRGAGWESATEEPDLVWEKMVNISEGLIVIEEDDPSMVYSPAS